MTVLDTTVLIDHLRGVPAARSYLHSLQEIPTCSEITRAEIIQGIRPAERGAAEQLFATLAWIPVDEPISRRAGELGRRYRASYAGLALADLIIAATAAELGMPLATSNARHFPMFGKLRPPY